MNFYHFVILLLFVIGLGDCETNDTTTISSDFEPVPPPENYETIDTDDTDCATDLLPAKCANITCGPPPKTCPNGLPKRPPLQCCVGCVLENVNCLPSVKCPNLPAKCPNGGKFRDFGQCCSECTKRDCSKVLCVKPTRYCNPDEIPRPTGACCATCLLDCTGIYCKKCQDKEAFPERGPNTCCPVCKKYKDRYAPVPIRMT